ncbi:acyl-CoA/acyl-ACP dehydrogenase [Staphylococcus warneri]|uniref:acyl-CoA dehydrogenase family protein n=1 Tax=Staphylococcus warneri TaxID=1292 RepID=UPI001888EFC3|nr:acyl-CoA dehydrogenase family protein [Staphylococcus warneri]MBF2178424.1 acyl-CoA/acyl-ACP dehydrogenase [Staphylococcus warneri]MBF2180107.1 acyl-CoA/acyl-ACP dehydrogenase [Staphylococcus warneri]MBF2184587.1 acyl-CoA/acyl-ACP dehydrogenase [Staphylococcus warneri]MBF2262822.1 acyl-CoA/acyl-ACP dehydrogenase [Staphylococcus warneri]MBF2265899.1 acyl-CoA/acyl-ACP dehydrogenase [Staphylococcus warneri]
MGQSLLVQTELQRKWIDKFKAVEEQFKSYAENNDIESRFPYENVQWLIDEGYTLLTLPKAYGGEGGTIEDMVILQTHLARIDGATALSIGWHLSVVGQLYEQQLWEQDLLDEFAEEVKKGALVNRAVSEAETGSPTRGGRPATNAVKVDDGYVLNGVKTFTSMSKTLTHFVVGAYVEELGQVGFFLVPRDFEGLEIADNWNMIGMRATESHDLVLNDVKIPEQYFVEHQRKPSLNGWILHIPSVYLGIAQAARDYAVDFAKTYSPNSIDGTIAEIPTVQQNLGKMESLLLSARHFLWSTAHGYQLYEKDTDIWNETSASKVLVLNQGLEVVDLAMRIVGAKSLEMERPLQRYYRDMRAGLHNPPMEDMAYTNIAKSITGLM